MTAEQQAGLDDAMQELRRQVEEHLGDDLVLAHVAHGELSIRSRPPTCRVSAPLRDDPNMLFKELVDICGVDYPEREQRFDVVYHLLSMHHNQRIRVRVTTDEATPVPSTTGLFRSAGWFEREAWDMYGILFSDHPDLRRCSPTTASRAPAARADFPLTGYRMPSTTSSSGWSTAGQAAPGFPQLRFLSPGATPRPATRRPDPAPEPASAAET